MIFEYGNKSQFFTFSQCCLQLFQIQAFVVTFCALANTIVWYRGQTASVNNISTSPFEERHFSPTQEHIAWNQSPWSLISGSNICGTWEI